jgi:hypothetical protein
MNRLPLDPAAAYGRRAGASRRTLGPGALALLAALLAGLVYLNALHNPFVYDDHVLVLQNPSIANVLDGRVIFFHSMTRPLTNFSYAIDYAIWGLQPFGYHVTNVLLHMLNVRRLCSACIR